MDENTGKIVISQDVIEKIIAHNIEAHKELSLYSKKGVKLEIKKDKVLINLMVKVRFGVRIPDLMWEIQKAIKEDIEKLTNYSVKEVNIHVQEFEFPESAA